MAQQFPPVRQIFNDLEKFRNWCRFEFKPFNEADLYNDKSPIWRQYRKFKRNTKNRDQ